MTSDSDFRTPEQEVQRLLEECAELRRTLKMISAQVGRMESRIKRSFPVAAELVRARQARSFDAAGVTVEQALAEFDSIVKLGIACDFEAAERTLREKPPSLLFAIARELGITFSKSRPSANAARAAILGKLRESILLRRHDTRDA